MTLGDVVVAVLGALIVFVAWRTFLAGKVVRRENKD